jgi:hypothetical protein
MGVPREYKGWSMGEIASRPRHGRRPTAAPGRLEFAELVEPRATTR